MSRLARSAISAPGSRSLSAPGTGLGAAALIPAEDSFVTVSGEAGHMDFSPPQRSRPRNLALAGAWRATHQRRKHYFRARHRAALPRPCAAPMTPRSGFSSAAEITAAALYGTDPQAVGTLDLFTTYLGRYAGDLAILFMARGGCVCLARRRDPEDRAVCSSAAAFAPPSRTRLRTRRSWRHRDRHSNPIRQQRWLGSPPCAPAQALPPQSRRPALAGLRALALLVGGLGLQLPVVLDSRIS